MPLERDTSWLVADTTMQERTWTSRGAKERELSRSRTTFEIVDLAPRLPATPLSPRPPPTCRERPEATRTGNGNTEEHRVLPARFPRLQGGRVRGARTGDTGCDARVYREVYQPACRKDTDSRSPDEAPTAPEPAFGDTSSGAITHGSHAHGKGP